MNQGPAKRCTNTGSKVIPGNLCVRLEIAKTKMRKYKEIRIS